MLTTGIKGTAKTVVEESNTAISMGSGGLSVFATPSMVALMECAAAGSVIPHIDEGKGTVGTKISISHTSATPVGMEVTAVSELIEIDGKRLVFNVEATDECGQIGFGTHERFIIDNTRFMEKTNSKKG